MVDCSLDAHCVHVPCVRGVGEGGLRLGPACAGMRVRVRVRMRGCGRKLSCIGMRGCGRKRKGVDENSWQSRQLHRRFQRLTVWIVQSNVCRALAGCVERTAGHASIWIATSFACGCSCTRSVSSTQPAASHHLPRVGNCLTVAAPRHGAAAPHRAVMGIKRRPVERPVEHTCAEAPRAPRN